MKQPPELPTEAPTIKMMPSEKASDAPGGLKIGIHIIRFQGNTVFSSETLGKLLGDIGQQEYDLAGIQGLADKITAYYHQKGYPFARAYIPAQALTDGELTLDVVEGNYGKVEIIGQDSRKKSAQGFLKKLKPGTVIEGKELERVSLVLDDQPGYRFIPVIRPGKEMGQGDLAFRMLPEKRFGGGFHVDNLGNRYTGRLRGQVDLYANSPFLLGDQLDISSIYTEGKMWFGSANYSMPLGHSGLRAHVGYAHTYYQLGKEFSDLDASGTAKVIQSGISYPLVRSQKTNLSLDATYLHKWLIDKQNATDTDNHKSSDSLRVALNFDKRDTLLGGGLTYGNLSWMQGILSLRGSQQNTDRLSAKTNGAFGKANLDVIRLQNLPVRHLMLMGRVSGQLATKNLDSSEDFGLGGPYGVRAYPVGEAYGDEGLLGQAELRYNRFKTIMPYVFYDYGLSKANHRTWTGGNNYRNIASYGGGLRINYKSYNMDVLIAWRSFGGQPQSDTQGRNPMFWFNVGYQL